MRQSSLTRNLYYCNEYILMDISILLNIDSPVENKLNKQHIFRSTHLPDISISI